jgi:hypothetical protein
MSSPQQPPNPEPPTVPSSSAQWQRAQGWLTSRQAQATSAWERFRRSFGGWKPQSKIALGIGAGCSVILVACVMCTGITVAFGSAFPSAPTQASSGQRTTTAATSQPAVRLDATATIAPTPSPTAQPTATRVAPTPTNPPCANPCNPWGYNFKPGKLIYSPQGAFCDYFNCIQSFWKSTQTGTSWSARTPSSATQAGYQARARSMAATGDRSTRTSRPTGHAPAQSLVGPGDSCKMPTVVATITRSATRHAAVRSSREISGVSSARLSAAITLGTIRAASSDSTPILNGSRRSVRVVRALSEATGSGAAASTATSAAGPSTPNAADTAYRSFPGAIYQSRCTHRGTRWTAKNLRRQIPAQRPRL